MGTKTSSRRFITARSRGMCALVSLIWLNLAMLPCAMALQQETICPDCPTDHEQKMPAHHEHGDSDLVPDCNTANSECCDFGEFTIDDRTQKSGKSDSEQIALVSDLASVNLSRHVSTTAFPTGPPDPTSGTKRLHAIFCVYLD